MEQDPTVLSILQTKNEEVAPAPGGLQLKLLVISDRISEKPSYSVLKTQAQSHFSPFS